MAQIWFLAQALCLLFIISALRNSHTSTHQGQGVRPPETGENEAPLLKGIFHDSNVVELKRKGVGGRTTMVATLNRRKFSKTSCVNHCRIGGKVSDFEAFTADYDGPQHHTPIHN